MATKFGFLLSPETSEWIPVSNFSAVYAITLRLAVTAPPAARHPRPFKDREGGLCHRRASEASSLSTAAVVPAALFWEVERQHLWTSGVSVVFLL